MKIKYYIAATLSFVMATASFAQTTINPTTAIAGDDPDGTISAFGDAYGAGSDTWRSWLFVGTPRETAFRDGSDEQDGAVYIYRRNAGGTYAFSQKLTMPGSAGLFGDRFGGGIEAAGGWLFVGSANDQDFPGLTDPRQGIGDPTDPAFQFAGQVHVYRLRAGNWEFAQTLISPEPGTNGSFGTRTQASHIALNSRGRVAVIGELNNFDGGIGQLHTYRLKRGHWRYVQTIDVPSPAIDEFGDDLVFANDGCLVAGGADFFADDTSAQGFIFAYQAKGNSGKFFATPAQTIDSPVRQTDVCFQSGFGGSGLDAGGGVVAVADACDEDDTGALIGSVSVYRFANDDDDDSDDDRSSDDDSDDDSSSRDDDRDRGCGTLVLEQKIPGDVSELSFGNNAFGSRHSIAVSNNGHRILIGTPQAPLGLFDEGAIGEDVRVYAFDGAGWINESNLTTQTPGSAIFRSLGDTVFFVDDETALVREGNFIDPFVTGLKGQMFFYDLTP